MCTVIIYGLIIIVSDIYLPSVHSCVKEISLYKLFRNVTKTLVHEPSER